MVYIHVCTNVVHVIALFDHRVACETLHLLTCLLSEIVCVCVYVNLHCGALARTLKSNYTNRARTFSLRGQQSH